MANKLVTDVYKKSYMLEFPEESFTFSVPPESEELTYTQRKTETKTFGGLHIDEYGVDAVRIVLSGSTINQSLKLIYKAGSESWLSGEDEIYLLRDLLVKYKTGKENLDKKVFLYDLSKSGRQGNSWQVAIGDFKIRRSKERPFTYNYTIEFTGYTESSESSMQSDSNIAVTPYESIDKGSSGASVTESARVEMTVNMSTDIASQASAMGDVINNIGKQIGSQ
ncbi:hypothetical protein FACS1894172_15260 [Spirochaetia bacterium]|nr:hypothetical protein FACS1894164_04050 [Spirochaetia bacterium]GHU34663.1 hypothetical protein FACS1894172_15260 [Spirochaetia bacterium]